MIGIRNLVLCLISTMLTFSCTSAVTRKTYPVTFHRTSLDQWETVERPALGIAFEKPKGLRTLGSSTSVLVQLHGLSAKSTFPSDTQYLITISIDRYTKEEWESDAAFQMKINKKAKDEKWLDFRQWAYSSLNPEVTMREFDGERYYRRSITNSQGAVVRVSTEYIPRMPEMIAEDEIAIRRIMSSVDFMAEKNEPAVTRPGNRGAPLNVSTNN